MRIDTGLLRPPVCTPETKAFWDAASNERLLFARCRACNRPHGYPRRVCPFCLSKDVVWADASGNGEIHAFSLFRKGRPEYVSAWVMLEEGVAVLTNIVDCETDALEIGMSVNAVFRPAENGQLVPVFTPA